MKKSRLILYSGLGWMFDALDVLILSYLLVAISSDFKLDSQARTWSVLANNLGMLTGTTLFGRLAATILVLLLPETKGRVV